MYHVKLKYIKQALMLFLIVISLPIYAHNVIGKIDVVDSEEMAYQLAEIYIKMFMERIR